jgi:hypothetical protein
MMSFIGKLKQASAQQAERSADPWRRKLKAWLGATSEISTAAALDLVGLANTSGNARQLARTMSSLGFLPTKSRRFFPGGRGANQVTRGWTRTAKPPKYRKAHEGEKVEGPHFPATQRSCRGGKDA